MTKQKTKKHSKFKNTGILFELLTKQITADILAGKDDSFAKKLMFKYFNENTALGKEFQLYNFITNNNKTKNIDKNKADRIVSLVLQSRNKINNKDLNKQKYNLIKEIKEKFDVDSFLKNKISNYKLYASIYKLFENMSGDTSDYDIAELVHAKEYVLEQMSTGSNVTIQSQENNVNTLFESQPLDVRLLTYKILIESFNKKYSNLLPEQKQLLKEYINHISDLDKFKTFVKDEYISIANKLKECVDLVDNDVIKIKINETINQLSTKKIVGDVKENNLTVLLNSYKLYNTLLKLKTK